MWYLHIYWQPAMHCEASKAGEHVLTVEYNRRGQARTAEKKFLGDDFGLRFPFGKYRTTIDEEREPWQ